MDLLLICVCGALALVFIAAGVGKLLDPSGSRTALQGFGVSGRWSGVAVRLLPVAELAVAAALLTQPLARIGAAAALLLLAAFIFGVGNALRQGRAPDCHCFGQLHSAPAGRGTIVRNVVLAVPALLVVVAGPGDALAGLSTEGSALVAVSALAVALAVATIILVRDKQGSHAEGEAPVPLELGGPAPDLSLRDEQGATVTMTDVIDSERPTVLVFVTPSCPACKDLVPRLERWRPALAERVSLVVVRATTFPPAAGEAIASGMLWDVENASFETFRLLGAPSAVRVDPGGIVASAPALGVQAIEALIRVARRQRATERPRTAA
ncbi:MAG: TlpA family protein disulfide reductase [Solirubrobacteraceae bacterium]